MLYISISMQKHYRDSLLGECSLDWRHCEVKVIEKLSRLVKLKFCGYSRNSWIFEWQCRNPKCIRAVAERRRIYFAVSKTLCIERAFRQRSSRVLVKAPTASSATVLDHRSPVFVIFFSFCGICSIFICVCVRRKKIFHMNEANFPHCLWKQSAKSSVPVVPLSFLSNRCKTLLRKHLFISFPQIFFFLSFNDLIISNLFFFLRTFFFSLHCLFPSNFICQRLSNLFYKNFSAQRFFFISHIFFFRGFVNRRLFIKPTHLYRIFHFIWLCFIFLLVFICFR